MKIGVINSIFGTIAIDMKLPFWNGKMRMHMELQILYILFVNRNDKPANRVKKSNLSSNVINRGLEIVR